MISFIAFKGPDGGVCGYARADRIETIMAPEFNETAPVCVVMHCGLKGFTYETLDEVFAKMADALHVPLEANREERVTEESAQRAVGRISLPDTRGAGDLLCACGGRIRVRDDRGHDACGCERCHRVVSFEELLDALRAVPVQTSRLRPGGPPIVDLPKP